MRKTNAHRPVVRALAALGDETRFRIVEAMAAAGRELTCQELGNELVLSASLLSHHLAVLENAGIVERRKDGLWTRNAFARDATAELLAPIAQLVEAR